MEWGLVAHRTPYVWIGVDSDLEVALKDAEEAKIPLRKDHARLEAVQAEVAATASPLDVVLAALHLFTSMRGTGYAFGPSTKVLRDMAGPTTPFPTFVKLRFLDLAWSHAVVLVCGFIMTAPPTSRIAFLHSITLLIPQSH